MTTTNVRVDGRWTEVVGRARRRDAREKNDRRGMARRADRSSVAWARTGVNPRDGEIRAGFRSIDPLGARGVIAGAWRAREGARARVRGAAAAWENVLSSRRWARGRGDEGARVDAPETRW